VRGAREAIRVALVVAVLVITSGCGFLHALAAPEAGHPSTQAVATTAAPATPDPDQPRVVADTDLLTTAGAAADHLVVSVGHVRSGLVPPVSDASPCRFDGPSLQYVPVDFTFGGAQGPFSSVAAHVGISTGPATPADIGDVGLFVESGNGDQVYCADYPPLPTRDKFFNQMGAKTIHAWVVLDRAVTAATPAGRPEVFPTLQLRISDLRRFASSGSTQTLVPGPFTVGATCPDDADEICVPLG